MHKYIGTYRVFQAIDNDGKAKNNDDTFLKCKYDSQIYRWDNKTLALYLTSTNTDNNVMPKLKKEGVVFTPYIEGDGEYVYFFPEEYIKKVASIMKPQIKGKNVSPKSIQTRRILAKKAGIKI